MKKKLFLAFGLVLLVASPLIVSAQVDSPDFFRSIGKMYVVVGVLLVILIGLFASLFILERRIAKIEKMNE